ncbi:hypothetical protein DNTS_033841 [Danionella cerebrum]|uniref:Uncharacterized protein n=1 Tax=Danionella cerebrum TaxID=2873325 RepID=A0A553N5E3_9TELE|nr:hypothetical protein DNTS_033841 [Danionella translucida]
MAAAARLGPKVLLLVHLGCFGWTLFTIWSNVTLQSSDKLPGVRGYGGRWKYLTFLNLVRAERSRADSGRAAVLRSCVFLSVSPGAAGRAVRSVRAGGYSGCKTCLSMFQHTAILPLLLLQMFLQNHKYPRRRAGILALAVFAALYLGWVLWVHYASGIWVYPIMAHLSPLGLAVFLGISCLTMAPLYLLGEKLSLRLWSAAALRSADRRDLQGVNETESEEEVAISRKLQDPHGSLLMYSEVMLRFMVKGPTEHFSVLQTRRSIVSCMEQSFLSVESFERREEHCTAACSANLRSQALNVILQL